MPALKSSIIARLNAGISLGLRAVTRLPSVTASLSTHSAPALRISVFRDGHEAILRPRATPASMIVHGPWQIAATGLPASKNDFTKATALGSMRNLSGLMTPPGSSSASKSLERALSSVRSAGTSLPHFVISQPFTGPSLSDTAFVQSFARLQQFHLLKAISYQDCYFLALQIFICHYCKFLSWK